MTARGTLVALALALSVLVALPFVASAAIVQKWVTTSGLNYRLFAKAGDFNGDGAYKLVTGEVPSGPAVKIGIRSGATGALLAQSTAYYTVNGMWLQDMDGDGSAEILVWDASGKFLCLHYTTGSSTLTQRWEYPVPTQFTWTFVDFDGNGRPCIAFKDVTSNNYWIINYNGIQIATFNIASGPTGIGWSTYLYANDYDYDDHMELLIDYHYANGSGTSDEFWMYDANGPTGVGPGGSSGRLVALGASFPNPTFRQSRIQYSMPAAGPASLRLFDVSGREVRTLVDGTVQAGPHEAVWDGLDGHGHPVPAGAYFYELNADGQRQTRRLVKLQ